MSPPLFRKFSDDLVYRDFITVGLLMKNLKVQDTGPLQQKLDQRQLDLHPGARRARRPAADIQ